MKVLDLLTTTSGNTIDKTISNSYNLYTDYGNDTVLIDFGDSTSTIIQLNQRKII